MTRIQLPQNGTPKEVVFQIDTVVAVKGGRCKEREAGKRSGNSCKRKGLFGGAELQGIVYGGGISKGPGA